MIVALVEIKSNHGVEQSYDWNLVWVVSALSSIVLGIEMMLFLRYSQFFHSAVLYKNGLCHLMGCLLSLIFVLNTWIITNIPTVWWLDPMVALIGGMISLWLGLQATVMARCVRGIPICSMDWWMLSQGDGRTDGSDDGNPSNDDGGGGRGGGGGDDFGEACDFGEGMELHRLPSLSSPSPSRSSSRQPPNMVSVQDIPNNMNQGHALEEEEVHEHDGPLRSRTELV